MPYVAFHKSGAKPGFLTWGLKMGAEEFFQRNYANIANATSQRYRGNFAAI
jgi:hypothetical protein